MKCEHNTAILIHVLTCCTHTFVNLQAFFFGHNEFGAGTLSIMMSTEAFLPVPLESMCDFEHHNFEAFCCQLWW